MITVTTPAFLCPDAYAVIPSSTIDAYLQGVDTFSFEVSATLFGATYKVQASDDKTNWVDLTTTDQVGVARPIDIPVAVGTTVYGVLDLQSATGAAGGAFRYYRLMGKNTVAASVASVIATILGK